MVWIEKLQGTRLASFSVAVLPQRQHHIIGQLQTCSSGKILRRIKIGECWQKASLKPYGALRDSDLMLKRLNYWRNAPGWCGSVDWALACEQKGHQFDSQSGHMPKLWAKSQVGGAQEATTHWCPCPSLSPFLPLYLKTKFKEIFKIIFQILKECLSFSFPLWGSILNCLVRGMLEF